MDRPALRSGALRGECAWHARLDPTAGERVATTPHLDDGITGRSQRRSRAGSPLVRGGGLPVAHGLAELDEDRGAAGELEETDGPMAPERGDSKHEGQREDEEPGRSMPPPLPRRRGQEPNGFLTPPLDQLGQGVDVHEGDSIRLRRVPIVAHVGRGGLEPPTGGL
jgi:hypothetical protein